MNSLGADAGTSSPATPAAIYKPPRQGHRGQLLDSLIILVLLMAVLFGVTYFVQSSSSTTTVKTKPLSQLDITPTERHQYGLAIKHGLTTLEGANEEVAENHANSDQYPIKIGTLILTILIIGGYLAFVYVFSFKEYKEVIREKFGPPAARSADTPTQTDIPDPAEGA